MIGRQPGQARRRWVGAAIAAMLASLPAVASAQDKKAPTSPVGGSWAAPKVTAEPAVSGITLDDRQLAIVRSVSDYFNTLENLRGNFVQTNAEKKRERGKFFVKRPGRLRFEYSPPSKQLIVSDGQQLQIADLDIGTDDRLALEQTSFRMLLRKDVDLIRDARILEVQEADDLVIVSLQDKSAEASGRIRLFMTKAPNLELKEWVATDAQGGDTRVEVSNLVKSEDLDIAMFKVIGPSISRNNQ